MANRFFNPNEQFCDPTGLPYAGGSLTFYAAGTTTPLATYSDKALSIPNTNPVVLDSAGRAGSIFLQNLAYKVVLADANSNVIWTFDNVYTSDFSTVAQFQSGSGSPNGSVAGSAGSSTIPASSYWDFTNNILYICTQTGTTSTAVWTAINSSSAAAIVVPPQGYLTPVSQTPIITSDQVGVSTVYYTPYVGNLIPIYNGTTFTPTVFPEIFCTLVANHAASTLYDFFVFNNGGTLTLVTGPAWSSSSAGAGSRGTGAGTTQLSRVNGLWVNTVSMTGRNGANTYTVPANQGTYVGSLYVDSVAGQVSFYRSIGQNRKWGVWNAYNRQNIILKVTDGASSWVYNSTTVRASNNNSGNSLTVFCGLPEESVGLRNVQLIQPLANATNSGASWLSNADAFIGIGVNSTTAITGMQGSTGSHGGLNAVGITSVSTATQQVGGMAVAEIVQNPFIGINTYTSLESATTSGSSFQVTFFGSSTFMTFFGSFRG